MTARYINLHFTYLLTYLLTPYGVIITKTCCVFEHFSIIICDQRDPLLRGRAASRVVGRHKRPHTVRVLI